MPIFYKCYMVVCSQYYFIPIFPWWCVGKTWRTVTSFFKTNKVTNEEKTVNKMIWKNETENWSLLAAIMKYKLFGHSCPSFSMCCNPMMQHVNCFHYTLCFPECQRKVKNKLNVFFIFITEAIQTNNNFLNQVWKILDPLRWSCNEQLLHYYLVYNTPEEWNVHMRLPKTGR